MPHTLRSVDLEDETIAELEMIVGFDADLAGEATRISNRLRGLITQIHPHLERVLGPRIQHPAILMLLERFGSPAQIRKAGRRRLITLIRPKAPRMAERLVEDIFAALDEQTVVVPGTDAAKLIVPSLAGSLTAVLDQRKLLAARLATSVQGPDVHAGDRRQDRSQDPHRRRRWQFRPLRRPPRRLRRPRSSNPKLGLLDPRRATIPARKQAAQMGLLPLRVRRP
ncbi:IS110 family transposase, partial [Streptomyces sp. ADI93-02]|uniref:IS110 family transposase n=1 Tax=Streptomyces sp. ADI93-02 TaxID=1522757 RepID=UPI001F152809